MSPEAIWLVVSELGFEPRKSGCRAYVLVTTMLSYFTGLYIGKQGEGSMRFMKREQRKQSWICRLPCTVVGWGEGLQLLCQGI